MLINLFHFSKCLKIWTFANLLTKYKLLWTYIHPSLVFLRLYSTLEKCSYKLTTLHQRGRSRTDGRHCIQFHLDPEKLCCTLISCWNGHVFRQSVLIILLLYSDVRPPRVWVNSQVISHMCDLVAELSFAFDLVIPLHISNRKKKKKKRNSDCNSQQWQIFLFFKLGQQQYFLSIFLCLVCFTLCLSLSVFTQNWWSCTNAQSSHYLCLCLGGFSYTVGVSNASLAVDTAEIVITVWYKQCMWQQIFLSRAHQCQWDSVEHGWCYRSISEGAWICQWIIWASLLWLWPASLWYWVVCFDHA